MYSVTKNGQIWSHYNDCWLKGCPNSRGYELVSLIRDKKQYSFHVHVLVLSTFVGLKPKGMQCRHLDGNKMNNKLSNLRWGTAKENQNDRKKHGTYLAGETNPGAKLTEVDVRMIIYMDRTGEFSLKEIADTYGITRQRVWQIVHKKAWKHIWEVNI